MFVRVKSCNQLLNSIYYHLSTLKPLDNLLKGLVARYEEN